MREKQTWVTPELQRLKRAATRRALRIQSQCLPCPKCGATPQVDLGFLDAPHPPGNEFISCLTVIEGPGIPIQSCGCHAIGVAAWNRRAPSEGAR